MRRLLLALLLSACAALAGTPTAQAGGPTSVLLTSPADEAAAALYYADPRYAELEELLHGAEAAAVETRRQPPVATSLNVTWLIHDVLVWRVDELVVTGQGAVWVATVGNGERPVRHPAWRELRDGGAVRALLDSLGLLGGPAASTDDPAAEPADDPADDSGDETAAPAVVAPAPPAAREETPWFSLTGWRWVLPGLLVGVLAGLVSRRSRPRAVATRAPRQELVDRTPASAG